MIERFVPKSNSFNTFNKIINSFNDAVIKIVFKRHKNRFTKKVFKNINKKRDGTYTSEGYTIPKTYLENNFKCYKKIYLRDLTWFSYIRICYCV